MILKLKCQYIDALLISLFFLLAVTLSGCGSSGGGSGGDSTPPQVSQTTPQASESDVEPDMEIRAEFDEDMLASSIDLDSVLLANNGTPVPGTVIFD